MSSPAPVQPVQTDPGSGIAQQVAQILAAALGFMATVEALRALFKPFRIGQIAIAAALRLSQRGTTATPRRMGGQARRAMATDDLAFRAAYVLNAARRIEDGMREGLTPKQAVTREARWQKAHEAARAQRLQAAAAVDRAAALHGQTLGWYLNPLLNNDPECIAANGNNFNARQRPIIGWPGAVHPNCGCYPGPPWYSSTKTVDEATRGIKHTITRVYKLKGA